MKEQKSQGLMIEGKVLSLNTFSKDNLRHKLFLLIQFTLCNGKRERKGGERGGVRAFFSYNY